jgi:hypothetical protein
MPTQQKLAKKLPKRCTNLKLKARREQSWQRTQERKKARIAAQNKRWEANQKLRAAGLPTPHEAKKLLAKARKDARV